MSCDDCQLPTKINQLPTDSSRLLYGGVTQIICVILPLNETGMNIIVFSGMQESSATARFKHGNVPKLC